jgi:hypothetical protein
MFIFTTPKIYSDSDYSTMRVIIAPYLKVLAPSSLIPGVALTNTTCTAANLPHISITSFKRASAQYIPCRSGKNLNSPTIRKYTQDSRENKGESRNRTKSPTHTLDEIKNDDSENWKH